jgi:hypothetical protein
MKEKKTGPVCYMSYQIFKITNNTTICFKTNKSLNLIIYRLVMKKFFSEVVRVVFIYPPIISESTINNIN